MGIIIREVPSRSFRSASFIDYYNALRLRSFQTPGAWRGFHHAGTFTMPGWGFSGAKNKRARQQVRDRPGRNKGVTRASPGSRELRAARLTRQNGNGNVNSTSLEFCLPPRKSLRNGLARNQHQHRPESFELLQGMAWEIYRFVLADP